MLFFIKILQSLPQVGRVINFIELAKNIYNKIGLKDSKSVFMEPMQPPVPPTNPIMPEDPIPPTP